MSMGTHHGAYIVRWAASAATIGIWLKSLPKHAGFFGHVFGCEGNYGCAFGDDVIVRWVPPVAVMGGGGSEVIHPASMPR